MDTDSEVERREYLIENELDICDPVYAAAFEYADFPPLEGVIPDPTWVPPLYEYRVGALVRYSSHF